jgi:hypothetical protein
VPNGGEGGISILSPNLHTLYLPWGEYKHGIGDAKQHSFFQERRGGKTSTSIIKERLSGG